MTPKVAQQYKKAKQDKEFHAALYKDCGDRPPGILADEIEKHIFAAIHYGWSLRNGDTQ